MNILNRPIEDSGKILVEINKTFILGLIFFVLSSGLIFSIGVSVASTADTDSFAIAIAIFGIIIGIMGVALSAKSQINDS